jgi:hypothetical protein
MPSDRIHGFKALHMEKVRGGGNAEKCDDEDEDGNDDEEVEVAEEDDDADEDEEEDEDAGPKLGERSITTGGVGPKDTPLYLM